MMRLGVMGGTFDPVHYGHLVAAQEVLGRLNLDRVVFIPCGEPPHKKDYRVSDPEHRYAMVVAATCAHPGFTAARIELERPGPSYTVDTLRELRARLAGRELFFITGADAVRELPTWHQPQILVRLARLIAVTRPGYDLQGLERDLGELARHVEPMEAPGVNVSSTIIRERIIAGRSIRYLTPPAVETYIAKHGLYRDGECPLSAERR